MLERLRTWASTTKGLSWLATALDVQKRFGEVRGSQLAAAITLLSFLALFPLLVFVAATLGFLSVGGTDVAGEVTSALGFAPGSQEADLVSNALDAAENSRRPATLVGLVGLAWAGTGLAAALQAAYNTVWDVPSRGWKSRLVAAAWLAGAGLLFLASLGVTAALSFLPAVLAPLTLLVGLALSFALWLSASRVLPNRDVGWRPLVPGAVAATLGFEILKVVGTVYVPRVVASSSALYGSLGLVFALLAWLLVFGRLIVYSAVLDVVLYDRRPSRA